MYAVGATIQLSLVKNRQRANRTLALLKTDVRSLRSQHQSLVECKENKQCKGFIASEYRTTVHCHRSLLGARIKPVT